MRKGRLFNTKENTRMQKDKRLTTICKTATVFLCLFFCADQTFQSDAGGVESSHILDPICAGAATVIDLGVEPTEEEIQDYVVNSWKRPGSLVMARVNDSVNVRLEPDENSQRVGKLYKDCAGYIIQYTDTWTKISSGELVGWVRNDYLSFGEDAQKEAEDVGVYLATVNTQTLRVRMEASTDSGVVGLVAEGDVYQVVNAEDDWVVIDFEGDSGYINTEYVDMEFCLDSGETMEQIEERERAEEAARTAARAAAAAASSSSSSSSSLSSYNTTTATTTTNYGSYAAEASDVQLLGALIQCEAGNQSYEGKLAVGAVVMNRVRSSAYPGTIYSVIFASGQFTPAGNGKVDQRLCQGVNASCLQAAQEAINGVSNVGTATHFRRAGSHDGIVIGGHVFW